MIPGSLAMQAASASAAPTFDPATLFSSGQKGAWYDASAWASVAFQDTAGSTPVTAAGQSIARLNDLSGRGNHVTRSDASNMPVLEIASGLSGVAASGGYNQRLTTGASIYNVINQGATPWEAFLAFRYNSVATNAASPYSNVAIVSDGSGWVELAFARSSGLIGMATGGGGGETNVTTAATVTDRMVFHGRFDGTNIIISINGGSESQVASVSSSGSNMQLLGGWNPAENRTMNGRFHEIIMRGSALTSTERADCINYLKSKWGVA